MNRLKYRWRAVRPQILSGALYWLVRSLGFGARFDVRNMPESVEKSILVGWHGRSAMFANYYRNRGFWVIISQSRDGEMQANIFRRLGFQIIRGSTGRGGVRAAVEGIKALKAGGTMAITPDGPRGPSKVVQGGVMLMAQKSGGYLVPVGVAVKPCLHARSWDKYIIPLPFCRVVILGGAPLTVPADATEEEVEALRLQLQEAMNEVEAEADRLAGY